MSDDRGIWIRDGLQQSLGHLGRLLIEDGVHTGDNDVHLRQDIVGEVEVAVSQDIDFDPGKDGDAVDFLSHVANALDVFDGALIVKAVGEREILRMIGDGHVLIAARLGRFGHLFDGVAAIGLDGMHVDIALQIFLRNQLGQGMVLRQVDFAEVLAHLRRNVVELELAVDFLFGSSSDRFLTFQSGQAVLVQRVSHLESALAQGNVVSLGSGEVLHGRAEGFRRKQTNINLQAVAQVKADLVVAAGDDVHQRRILCDVGDGLLARGFATAGLASDENVEIANGFAATTQ